VDRLLLYSGQSLLFHIHGSQYSPLDLTLLSLEAERIAVQHVAMYATDAQQSNAITSQIRSQRNAAQMLLDRLDQILHYLLSSNPSPALLRDIQSLCYRLEDSTSVSTRQIDLEMLLAALTRSSSHASRLMEAKPMRHREDIIVKRRGLK
jgi:hypothetical protein